MPKENVKLSQTLIKNVNGLIIEVIKKYQRVEKISNGIHRIEVESMFT